jgi:hypothetical protein
MLKELNYVVEKFKDVQIGSYPKEGYVVLKFSGENLERVRMAKETLKKLLGL